MITVQKIRTKLKYFTKSIDRCSRLRYTQTIKRRKQKKVFQKGSVSTFWMKKEAFGVDEHGSDADEKKHPEESETRKIGRMTGRRTKTTE